MPQLESKDGARIAYERSGRRPRVLLVDGAMAHRGYRGGRALAAKLRADFEVVTYDRRGRGESGDRMPYAVEREIEDLEALIDALGGSAALYGFSSGAVLALRAAAALPAKVTRLVVFEPPFSADDDRSRRETAEYVERMSELLGDGKRSEAVELFLQDMLPPEAIAGLKQSREWEAMQGVAPTLAYDNAVLGEGTVPVAVARSVAIPVLVLVGADSPPFKHAAAMALARALPRAEPRTLPGQDTLAPVEVVAPILKEFLGRS